MNWLQKPKLAKLILNSWPPLIGAGIKIIDLSEDYKFARVRLKLRWWNKNANRTQFGGSIFAMTDLMFATMLMGALGKEYFIWDKNADIDYIKPGKTELFADFIISDEKIDEIIELAQSGEKIFPEFIVNILDANGDVVARVRRIIYVRKKPQYRESPSETQLTTQ